MAKPIAGINDYPYGVCGFIVDGALLKNGTKLKNLRIYKQRSVNVFDLIDPVSNVVYQKIQLTGYNTSNRVLDYNLTDDQILNQIPLNSFFVRGYNSTMSKYGFVIRFQYNKVALSSGVYLYDMYTPECNIPTPELGTIVVNTVTVDSTSVSGSVSAASGSLNETGMVVILVTPEGDEYTTTVQNRVFIFTDVQFYDPGTGHITITSPFYNTATVSFEVFPSGEDTEFTTSVPVSANQFVDNGDGTFSYMLAESVHERGSDLVIQIQTTNGIIYNPEVLIDSTGNITVTQDTAQDLDIVIVGPTNLTSVYSTGLVWTLEGMQYEMVIPYTTHNKPNPVLCVYDGNTLVSITVEIDDNYNITLYSNDNFTGKVVIAGK